MRFFAETYGDRSVGIDPTRVTLEVHGVTPESLVDEDRQYILTTIGEIAETMSGGEEFRMCWAEDECPDCGDRGYKDGKCSRKDCIQNAPEEQYFPDEEERKEMIELEIDVMMDEEFRHSE